MKKHISPWDYYRNNLNKLGYTDEEIDEMTLAELSELKEQKN